MARRYSGLAAGIDVITGDIQRKRLKKQQDEEARRAFEQKLALAGLENILREKSAIAQEDRRSKNRLAELEAQHRYKMAEKGTNLLSESETRSMLQQARPGTPYSGTVPFSQAGQNTLQAAITRGDTESPAAFGGLVAPQQMPTAEVPPGLELQGYTTRDPQSGQTRIYRRPAVNQPAPATPRAVDPATRANQVAALQQKLQQIKMANELAPILASGKIASAYPQPSIPVMGGLGGGYVTEQPSMIQKLTGVRQRPQAPAIQPTDTAWLEAQLAQIMGQGQGPAAQQRSNAIGNADYQLGSIVQKGGKAWRIVGFDATGEPLVEPAQ